MKRLQRLLVAFGLVTGFAAVTLPLASEAGAAGGVTYYVNSSTDTGASDCASPTNTDCGVDDAIAAFDADATANDSDTIILASSINPFITNGTAIDNTTTGVTLAITGSGPSAT
jgi:hypothetical protein